MADAHSLKKIKDSGIDPAAGIAFSKLAATGLTASQHGSTMLCTHTHAQLHDRLHSMTSTSDHSGTIDDTMHGNRGAGLHSDSHPRIHAIDSTSDHTGTINDTIHGNRGAGLHSDSHPRSHAMDSTSDHTGTISAALHGTTKLCTHTHAYSEITGKHGNEAHSASYITTCDRSASNSVTAISGTGGAGSANTFQRGDHYHSCSKFNAPRIWYSSSTPSAADNGDIWVDTSASGVIYVKKGGYWYTNYD